MREERREPQGSRRQSANSSVSGPALPPGPPPLSSMPLLNLTPLNLPPLLLLLLPAASCGSGVRKASRAPVSARCAFACAQSGPVFARTDHACALPSPPSPPSSLKHPQLPWKEREWEEEPPSAHGCICRAMRKEGGLKRGLKRAEPHPRMLHGPGGHEGVPPLAYAPKSELRGAVWLGPRLNPPSRPKTNESMRISLL